MAQASVGHTCNEVCRTNPQRCPRHTGVRARTWFKSHQQRLCYGLCSECPRDCLGGATHFRRAGHNLCMRVPWWALWSKMSRNDIDVARAQGPAVTLPRVRIVERDPCLNAGHCLPFRVWESLRVLDTALMRLQRFWVSFADHFEKLCLGDVGVNREMQTLYDALSKAFWLEDVVDMPYPTEDHKSAICIVYENLWPDLRIRPWPKEGHLQRPAPQRWPNEVTMVALYGRWWNRIHATARLPNRSRWWRVESYEVVPVRAMHGRCPVLCVAIGIARISLRQRGRSAAVRIKHPWGPLQHVNRDMPPARRAAIVWIAVKLMEFLGVSGPHTSFAVRPEHIRLLGRERDDLPRVRPTYKHPVMATLRTPRLRKRIVLMVGSRRSCDQREITASLENERYFAEGGLYNVNSMFCLARRMGSTEQPCEKWVGCLKLLFSARHRPTATSLAQRAKMHASGHSRITIDYQENALRRNVDHCD